MVVKYSPRSASSTQPPTNEVYFDTEVNFPCAMLERLCEGFADFMSDLAPYSVRISRYTALDDTFLDACVIATSAMKVALPSEASVQHVRPQH